jgi:Zn-dependent peptidase ImmA (M78 family)
MTNGMNGKAEWLLDYANKLNPDGLSPLHIRRLLRSLEISLRKVTKRSGNKREAELHRLGPGQYCIYLTRTTNTPRPLSVRERFTLAHEIGHVLLDYKFNWRPTSEREYHLGERLCNVFAARLLVPEAALTGLAMADPQQGLATLTLLARRFRVSKEVAARRIAEVFLRFGFVEGEEIPTRTQKRGFQIAWSTLDSARPGLTRRRKLGPKHPLTRFLLDPPLDWTSIVLPREGMRINRAEIDRQLGGRMVACMEYELQTSA